MQVDLHTPAATTSNKNYQYKSTGKIERNHRIVSVGFDTAKSGMFARMTAMLILEAWQRAFGTRARLYLSGDS